MISAGILLGSQRDFGCQDIYFRWEFRQDPGKILTWKKSWRPTSRRDPAANLAKILAGKQKSLWIKSLCYLTTNLAKILAGKQKFWWSKSRFNSTANLAKILAEKQIHSGKNLGAILPGILPRFAAGSKILGENLLQESQQNFRRCCHEFLLEPSVYVLEISYNTDKTNLIN